MDPKVPGKVQSLKNPERITKNPGIPPPLSLIHFLILVK
jgi:hypothetical protein